MAADNLEALRDAFRQAMPVTDRYAYFDHAALAPLPAPARDAIVQWAGQSAESGDVHWPEWSRGAQQTRTLASSILDADAAEIALVPSTTAGINIVAEGLDWREGDNVVTLSDEFPSNLYPWMHQRTRGVETRRVETDNGRIELSALKAACDARTRLVAISWVGYLTGYRQRLDEIAKIAHDAGALFFVDAIQGLGAFPLSVRQTPIDYLAAGGQKWMLGPEAVGIAYLPKERMDLLRPVNVGWNSMTPGFDYGTIKYEFRQDAARYEASSMNMPGWHALGASLQLLATWDAAERAAAILETTDYACDRLRSLGCEIASWRDVEADGHDPRSGIVSFTIPGQDPNRLRRRCLDAQIVLSCRGGRLRIAAHAYNNKEDVDRLIDCLSGAV